MVASRFNPTHWFKDVDINDFGPVTELPTRFSTVVIGGGLMGVATAYWLAKSGVDVLLIESHRLAWGATGRNAGMMLAGRGPIEDPELFKTILREESIQAEYDEPGHLALASCEEVWDKVRIEAMQYGSGPRPIYALDRGMCEELLGMSINKRFLGGRWFPDGGIIHPARFVYGLALAAENYGAKIVTETIAHQISRPPRHDEQVVYTSGGPVRTEHVLFACNAAVQDFLPEIQRIITPIRGQVMSTEPLPMVFRHGMAVDWGAVYWRQTGEGNIVIGGCRNVDPSTETGTEQLLNPQIQSALDGFLSGAFPGFPPIRVRKRWSGIMDCSKDGRPLIGNVPGVDNQWIIAGFGGHGMPAGLGAGNALAQAIISGKTPDILRPFDPCRFKWNQENGAQEQRRSVSYGRPTR